MSFAEARFQERVRIVHVGADRFAFRTEYHAVDDVLLRRHFARVIVEQEKVEAEDRVGTDE